MRNMQVLKSNRHKAGVFSLMLAACLLLFLPGCQGPLGPREADGTGNVSLTIGTLGAGRAIMPESYEIDSFQSFSVVFTRVGLPALPNVIGVVDIDEGDGTVTATVTNVREGNWNLVVTAYLGANATLPAARYTRAVTVVADVDISINALLRPIRAGYTAGATGTFEWDIVFPAGTESVGVRVYEFDADGDFDYLKTVEFEDLDAETGWDSTVPLPIGDYFVVFELAHPTYGTLEFGKDLHVYWNMVSRFPPEGEAPFAFLSGDFIAELDPNVPVLGRVFSFAEEILGRAAMDDADGTVIVPGLTTNFGTLLHGTRLTAAGNLPLTVLEVGPANARGVSTVSTEGGWGPGIDIPLFGTFNLQEGDVVTIIGEAVTGGTIELNTLPGRGQTNSYSLTAGEGFIRVLTITDTHLTEMYGTAPTQAQALRIGFRNITVVIHEIRIMGERLPATDYFVAGPQPVLVAPGIPTVAPLSAQDGVIYADGFGDGTSATFTVTGSNIFGAGTSVDFGADGVVGGLSAAGLVASGTASISPANGAVTGTLTLTSEGDAVLGTHPLTLTIGRAATVNFEVEVTLYPYAPGVSVAAQVGTMNAGTTESVTFDITGVNLTGPTYNIENAGVLGLPAGITASGTISVTAGAGTGTLTLTSTYTSVAGEFGNLRLQIGGATSDVFTLRVLGEVVIFDMQDLTVAQANTHFAGANNRGVVTAAMVGNDLEVRVTNWTNHTAGAGGINNPAGWGWAPLTILRTGQGQVAGDVLRVTGRIEVPSGVTLPLATTAIGLFPGTTGSNANHLFGTSARFDQDGSNNLGQTFSAVLTLGEVTVSGEAGADALDVNSVNENIQVRWNSWGATAIPATTLNGAVTVTDGVRTGTGIWYDPMGFVIIIESVTLTRTYE